MSNVVAFLEQAGRDAQLRYASGEQLINALAAARIEPQAQAAILSADSRRLESLLGATPNVCCVVQAPQDDEPDRDEPDQKQDQARLFATPA